MVVQFREVRVLPLFLDHTCYIAHPTLYFRTWDIQSQLRIDNTYT